MPSEVKWAWFNNSTVAFGSSLYLGTGSSMTSEENGTEANLCVLDYRAHFSRSFSQGFFEN
jgi:hypothetical protein